MLSDSELAAYLDGAFKDEDLRHFEELAAEDDGAMREIVAQRRVHRLLRLHADGAKDVEVLKEAILDAALGKGLRDASAGVHRRSQEPEPNLVLAILFLVAVVLIAFCLWYHAPRP